MNILFSIPHARLFVKLFLNRKAPLHSPRPPHSAHRANCLTKPHPRVILSPADSRAVENGAYRFSPLQNGRKCGILNTGSVKGDAMKRRYRSAAEIFPEALLREMQQYAGGEWVYIPEKEERKNWGEVSGARLLPAPQCGNPLPVPAGTVVSASAGGLLWAVAGDDSQNSGAACRRRTDLAHAVLLSVGQ